ncbi:MAG: laccase domain-containing protein, partial [Candidatus Acidiferrales bacterium]
MKTIRKNKFIARGKKRVAKSRSSAAGRSSLSPAADWKLRRSRGLQVIESSALGSLRWLVHGFSTRSGGTSEQAAAHAEEAHAGSSRARGSIEPALNLGFTDWDASERVQANRHRFFHALGADGWRVVTLRQIHSDIVHLVESPRRKTSTSAGASDLPATGSLAIDSPNGDAPQGDALITRAPGTLLVVQTADCVPILLADTRHRAVAAIHSGWRGTVRRIAEKTLGRMQMEFGTRPRDV